MHFRARSHTLMFVRAERVWLFYKNIFYGKIKQEINVSSGQRVSIRLKRMYVNTYFKKNRWKKMQLLHGTVQFHTPKTMVSRRAL